MVQAKQDMEIKPRVTLLNINQENEIRGCLGILSTVH